MLIVQFGSAATDFLYILVFIRGSMYSYWFFFFLSCDAELDALEADMGFETEGDGVPSYLQPDQDLESELNLPSAPSGNPPGRANVQVTYSL